MGWRSKALTIFCSTDSTAKTQIPTGKSPHAPSCENPRHFPSQFYFKISEYVVNIYEISVGFTFYVEQILVNLHTFVYGMLCSQTNKQTNNREHGVLISARCINIIKHAHSELSM